MAAGEGTRLRPHTDDRPKPMVSIAGQPAIGYSLRWLRSQGVREVAINLHYRPEVLRAFVGDGAGFGLRVTYSHETRILGTSGALRPLTTFFASDPVFVVVYGDVLTDLDLGEVVNAHRESAADATIVLTRVEDPTRAGVVAYDAGGWITKIVEKPSARDVFSDWANAGIYVCCRSVLEYVASEGSQDFARDLFPAMLRDGRRLRAHPTDALVIDFGAPERVVLAERAVRHGALGAVSQQLPC